MTSIQEEFKQRLYAQPDDQNTRLIYADWLDDNGQHEEAQRQRQWQASKQWLLGISDGFKQLSQKQSLSFIQEALVDSIERLLKPGLTEVEMQDFISYELISRSLPEVGAVFWRHVEIVTGFGVDSYHLESTYYDYYNGCANC